MATINIFETLEQAEQLASGHSEIKAIVLNRETGKYFHSFISAESYYRIWGNKITYEIVKELNNINVPTKKVNAVASKFRPMIKDYLK